MLLKFSKWIIYHLIGMPEQSTLAAALEFFIYDSIKILMLLYFMIFIVGILRTYLPQKTVRLWMKKKGGQGNIFASLFGALTPFCSCSSIPLFLGFLEIGIPLGVTFSFLITSPLINEYLVVLMLGFFGWKITLLYIICGIFIGVFTGLIIGKLQLEDSLTQDLLENKKNNQKMIVYKKFKERLLFGAHEAQTIVKKIWIWILVGVGIGAVIHNYIPNNVIQSIIKTTGPFSVPLATLLGVPMYGSCAAIVPIAVVLFKKGIPLGTAMAFMMATAALSLPEAVMLRRAMKINLILIFFGITTVAIIFTGYILNIFQNLLI